MKYKKHIATGALAISLLVGGSSVYASTPQDLGIKSFQTNPERHRKGGGFLKHIKRHHAVGSVSAISDTGFILEVNNKKTNVISSVDIKTDADTIYNENGVFTTKNALAVGKKVIVLGPLDKTTNIIMAKKVRIAQ